LFFVRFFFQGPNKKVAKQEASKVVLKEVLGIVAGPVSAQKSLVGSQVVKTEPMNSYADFVPLPPLNFPSTVQLSEPRAEEVFAAADAKVTTELISHVAT
jgi:hypothetical protein